MFGSLKKKLSESVEKLTERAKKEKKPEVSPPEKKKQMKEEKREPAPPEKEKPAEEPEMKKKRERKKGKKEEGAPKPEKGKGLLSRFRGKKEKKPKPETMVSPAEKVPPEKIPEKEKRGGLKKKISGRVLERKITESDINSLFDEMELGLMEANVALEVVDFLKSRMKKYLVHQQVKRGNVEENIRETLRKVLKEIFDKGKVDLEGMLKEKRPLCLVFLGFNGSGKTTSIAKLAKHLMKNKHKVVLAAGDTFRAAAIDQLETHAGKLGTKVVKHDYGSDAAAVVFDAVKYADSKGIDFVLADTAGRSHKDKNLMDELRKVIRVNRPDLKIMVIDSLTGNDVVEQAKQFDEAVGVDCIVFTKVDVNKKGGSLLSACHVISKPILFIGTGQKYEDIELFDPDKLVGDLMSG